jgi:hypothetical protein
MPCTCWPSCHSSPLILLSHFNRVLENPLALLMITMHGPGSREAGIGQARACPEPPMHASMRAHPVLGALERQLDPSPPSSSTPLLLHRAPPPHQLATRHTRAPARAPSPSSSSTFRRQYRDRFFIIASDPVTFSLRQLAVEHRQDASYATPSLPWPFAHRRRRAILDLHGHPQLLVAAINRTLPHPNSSHSLLLLPSLILLDQLASQIVTGAAPIRRRSPPVPADRCCRLELSQATPPVPGASSSTPMSPRTSPLTAGAPVGSPTP